MPTIDDHAPRNPRPARQSRPLARVHALQTAWPLVALALLVLVVGWRFAGPGDATDEPAHPAAPLAERAFGEARLDVPREWITLDRSPEHVTWGDPARRHTVTLAHVEASALPLPAVVAAMTDQSGEALPGARLVDEPRQLDVPGRHAGGDSAMLARFHVKGDPPLEVAQVWRRDGRAGIDLVATWTSADGTWVVRPRDAIPRAAASG